MIQNKEFFGSLKEKDLKLYIEFVDNGRYSTKGIGTVTFNRETSSRIQLKDVMYLLGLKKNLIFVVILYDRGYAVFFSKWKAFFRHVATRKVKQIGVRVEKLYKLAVYFAMHAVIPPGVRWGNVNP